MSLLLSLGINGTVFIQFCLFVVTVTFMSLYVFKPYAQALDERENRTKGSQDVAQEIHQKTIELHSEYEVRAREVHGHIHEIYQKARTSAAAEYEAILKKAREEAATALELSRSKLTKAIEAAAQELKAQVSPIAAVITQKLLGK